jgi:hypothetical protein
VSTPALAIRQTARIGGKPHVIAGQKEAPRWSTSKKPWRTIRKTAGLDDVRLHDLRHAFAR